jgi:hypothetical protein
VRLEIDRHARGVASKPQLSFPINGKSFGVE